MSLHYNTHRNVKHLFNNLLFPMIEDRKQEEDNYRVPPSPLAPSVIPILQLAFLSCYNLLWDKKRKLPKNCCNYLLVYSTIGVAIVTYNVRCFFMRIILILSTPWISLINTFLSGHQIYTNAFSFFFRHFGLFCSSHFTRDIKTLYKTVFKMRIKETIFSNW